MGWNKTKINKNFRLIHVVQFSFFGYIHISFQVFIMAVFYWCWLKSMMSFVNWQSQSDTLISLDFISATQWLQIQILPLLDLLNVNLRTPIISSYENPGATSSHFHLSAGLIKSLDCIYVKSLYLVSQFNMF